MSKPIASKPDYGNWVPSKMVYVPAALAVLLGGLSVFSVWLVLPALLFFACACSFAYGRWKLSARGGDIQSKIWALVLQHLHWQGEGEVLDVGCGNGPLTIAIAKAYRSAHVTGIDYWGGPWAYSKAVCERNAAVEGVTTQVTFQKASAAELPFNDGTFDVVVSNLAFHEVRGVADKKLVIKEALRVLKKGGIFVFQDLFLLKRIYGDIGDLLSAIRGWGVAGVDFVATNEAFSTSKVLKLPFMVGTIGIVHGSK